MIRAIKAVKPGRQVNVIGRVIESYAKRFGYGVVREYTGHGVHTAFHSGLVIPHYDEPFYDTVIKPGMTFTIEPMITLGAATGTCGTTAGPCSPPTAADVPSSSTPWWSPRTARKSSPIRSVVD